MSSNILVVDDNDLNVELIVQLIEDYTSKNDININIFIANNGQEAIDICNALNIDVIFMDIMMPIMDGREATKIIKQQHPKTMIIVVSALGNESEQKEMLLNGAEDYITKPIVASVFKSRLNNYIQLANAKHSIHNSSKAKNLFTSKVYSYHMNFNIESEDQLAEFWEAMLIRLNFQEQVEHINNFVRFIFNIGTLQLKQKFKFSIIVEESAEKFYFTINNIQLIGRDRFVELIKTYFTDSVYECKDNKVTFALNKCSSEDTCNVEDTETSKDTKHQELKTKEPISYASKTQELSTYDILDPNDLAEFEEYLININSIVLLMENSTLEDEEIADLCNYFNSIASILSVSNDIYVISDSLRELSNSIAENSVYFNENASMLFEFTRAFVNDLSFWKTKIFYEGAPSVDFLNDSITTNANMLNALLKPEDTAATEDLDDIFDF
jgi:two-component system chemotaxis response regulator CheY